MARITKAIECVTKARVGLAAVRDTHHCSPVTLDGVIAELDDALGHLRGDEEDKPAPYGEYVRLTKKDYDKLVATWGRKNVDQLIVDMDNYCGAKGCKYKDYYRALCQWFIKRDRESGGERPATDKKTPLFTGRD